MLGLEIRAPGEAPRYVEIHRDVMSFGRHPNCDVLLANPFVSLRHAELRKVKDHYVLQDGGSTNGTLLNGERVLKGKDRRLHNGDEIRIDEYVVGFIDVPGIERTLVRPVRLPDALYVDEAKKEVWIGERKLEPPPPLEVFRLLSYLYERRNEFCSTDEVGSYIWGRTFIDGVDLPQFDLNMVHQLVSRLRKLIEPTSGLRYIRSVRRMGYCLSERPTPVRKA